MKLTPAQRHRQAHLEALAKKAEERAFEAQRLAEEASTPVAATLTIFDRQQPPPAKGRISPAIRHRTLMAAAAVIAKSGASGVAAARPDTGPEATEYNLLRAQLGEHMHQLSAIKSVEKKIEAKREMIDAYDAHVLGVLEAAKETDKAVQDEVFVTIMIWRFDIGDFAMALEMAEYILKFGLELPERYNREPATMIGDMVSDAALKAQKLESPFDYQVIARAIELTEAPGQNVNDIVRAKLQRAMGCELLRLAASIDESTDGVAGAKRAAEQQALTHLKRALELHENCGIKKEYEGLAKRLAKTPSTTET